MYCMQTFYLHRCLRDEFVTAKNVKSMQEMRLTSALRVSEDGEKCKSTVEMLSLLSADPQLF
jgi:hypothetical protein